MNKINKFNKELFEEYFGKTKIFETHNHHENILSLIKEESPYLVQSLKRAQDKGSVIFALFCSQCISLGDSIVWELTVSVEYKNKIKVVMRYKFMPSKSDPCGNSQHDVEVAYLCLADILSSYGIELWEEKVEHELVESKMQGEDLVKFIHDYGLTKKVIDFSVTLNNL